jgi:hypothetical protein
MRYPYRFNWYHHVCFCDISPSKKKRSLFSEGDGDDSSDLQVVNACYWRVVSVSSGGGYKAPLRNVPGAFGTPPMRVISCRFWLGLKTLQDYTWDIRKRKARGLVNTYESLTFDSESISWGNKRQMLSVKHGKALVTRGTIESIVKKSLWLFSDWKSCVSGPSPRFPERPGYPPLWTMVLVAHPVSPPGTRLYDLVVEVSSMPFPVSRAGRHRGVLNMKDPRISIPTWSMSRWFGYAPF